MPSRRTSASAALSKSSRVYLVRGGITNILPFLRANFFVLRRTSILQRAFISRQVRGDCALAMGESGALLAETAHAAAHAAYARRLYAHQLIHFMHCVVVPRIGVVHQYVVGLAYLPARLAAERAHGRGQIEYPYRCAYRYMAI